MQPCDVTNPHVVIYVGDLMYTYDVKDSTDKLNSCGMINSPVAMPPNDFINT